ncbi:TetR/AcrR family transcriptional regulator [Halorubrum vacuolatum]|uniref:Transcriptional regulator, TetR family n=1 Tax=Halorubrum vacuolatum TaxID=63740 RepID=A0A238X782_HALVU|nr:TetR/AcrR family transcriptional regulator [Halorubrum vacuolatum]SNR54797.1 transcriptional regulator, TetR family [Halorubrum vacuolatum]
MSEERRTTDEIMDGVYRALCAHGYGGLTMQKVADECAKSKSLLHYHYDTKEDLLVTFLERAISDFERRVAARADRPPAAQLMEIVCWFVFESDETDRESFHIGLLELRSQGPFNERIHEQLVRSDQLLRGTIADILTDGIAAGVFREVDVERTAALLVATLDGARTRQITMTGVQPGETAYTRAVAEATVARILEPLLAEGVELPTIDETIASMPARTGGGPRESAIDEEATAEDDRAGGADEAAAEDENDHADG